MKLSEYIEKFGDGTLVDIYDKEQIKQLSGVGKVKYIAIVEEDKVFVPKENERYCFVNDVGEVDCFYNNQQVDKEIFRMQQVYRTEAEAEFARDKAIFLEFMRKEFLRNSDTIDWEDAEQYKFSLEFGYQDDEILMCSSLRIKSNVFYTTNEYWLKQFIDKHEDEIKKYYFEVGKA